MPSTIRSKDIRTPFYEVMKIPLALYEYSCHSTFTLLICLFITTVASIFLKLKKSLPTILTILLTPIPFKLSMYAVKCSSISYIEKRVFLKVYVLQWIAWWLHLHKLSIISKISVYLLQEMLADAPLWPEQPTARPSVPHATNQKWRRKQWEYIIYCKTIWTIVLHFDSNSLTISIPNGLSHTWRMAYQEGLNAFSKSWKNRTIWKLIIHNLI